ncbi:MAG: serine/threonine-protein kinase [Planctomycetota bacterium]
MEYIRGVPILEYCDTERLDTRARLELFVQVCNAIQHAHQKGIVHRDVKPSNVLVTLRRRAGPKVIDFGIAKATSAELTTRTLFTEHRQMIGTPAYMSPEQAEMSGLDVDTRTDIYSLGVLLYELLTGTTPFDPARVLQEGLAEMLRYIREVEPRKPSTRISELGVTSTRTAALRRSDPRLLGSLLRGDLDWIVMKCLEKDRSRRYDTASALATDVRRHLAHEPVAAGPPSTIYRLRKLARRNRLQVAAGLAVAIALVAGVVGTSFGLVRALDEKERADGEASRALAAFASESEARRDAEDAATRAERELGRATEVGRVLRETLIGVTPEIAQTADTELLVRILDATSERLASGEIADETIAAELHHIVGRVYLNLGRYERAERHLPVAAALHERLYGPDDERTLAAVHDHLGLLVLQGRSTDVEARLRDLIERHVRVLGADHPATLAAQVNLASVLSEAGRHAEAAELLERTNASQAIVLGPESSNTLRSAANRALELLELGDLRAAEALARRTLATQRRVLGEGHPDTLATWRTLAVLCRDLGRYEECERIHDDTLEMRREVLGDEHPNMLAWNDDLAQLYAMTGRADEAIALDESNLAIRERILGADNDDTLLTKENLAHVLARIGKGERAVELVEEVVATTRALHGESDRRTLDALSTRAHLYGAIGDHARSEELQREVYERRKETFGAEDPATLATLSELAMVCAARGRVDEAVAKLEEALEAERRTLGEDHEYTLGTSSNLALLYSQSGRLREGRELSASVLDARRRVLGDEHPATIDAMINAAGAMWDLAEFDEARELCERVVELRVRTLGQDAAATLLARNNLALIVAVGGDLERALALHEEILATRRRTLGDDDPETVASLANVATVAARLYRTDRAEEAYREALAIFERHNGSRMLVALQSRLGLAALRANAGADDEVVELLAPHLVAMVTAFWPESSTTETAIGYFREACANTGASDEHAEVLRDVLERRVRLARRADAPPDAIATVAHALIDTEFDDLRDLDTALELAERACSGSGANDGALCFGALARARLERGDAVGASEASARALELLATDDPRRDAFESFAAEAAARARAEK